MSVNFQEPLTHEKETIPTYLNRLPDFARKKCEEELKETPEKRLQGIKEMKELLANEKATEGIHFEDDFIIQYLRHSKYDIKKAFNRLKNFVNFTKTHSFLFETFPDEYFSTKSSIKALNILPKKCQDGCTIINFQIGKWNPSEVEFPEVKRFFLMTFLQVLRDPMAQINGLKIIYDFEGTTMKHLLFMTIPNLYLIVYVGFQCIPGRYKQSHIINHTFVSRAAWAIIKVFLPRKIKDAIFFHSEVSNLLNYFPPSVLPVKYGGKLDDTEGNVWIRKANREHEKFTAGGQCNIY